MRRVLALIGIVGFAGPVGADGPTPEAPTLTVRAQPRVAIAPVPVFIVAELVGGDDVEEYYCPGLLWDWGDGSRSATESDCPPFERGSTIRRLYTARHVYRGGGVHSLRVVLYKADEPIAEARTSVHVRSMFH